MELRYLTDHKGNLEGLIQDVDEKLLNLGFKRILDTTPTINGQMINHQRIYEIPQGTIIAQFYPNRSCVMKNSQNETRGYSDGMMIFSSMQPEIKIHVDAAISSIKLEDL